MALSADVATALMEEKVIAILRGVQSPRAEAVVGALQQGGVRFIEITVEVEGGIETLAVLRRQLSANIILGAGTVTTPEQADEAVLAGAEYLVSPGLFADVSDYTRIHDVLYIPGVLTATEVGEALRRGHTILKLFPAGLMGPEYLRALQAPYPQARFFAVGNIGVDDVAKYLHAGAAGVAMGSQLVGRTDAAEIIAARARTIVEKIRESARA
jgi:2-dehydro-3-deoxyphosphogluconate aldolase/(4S)-4-hydroxy-2-oxoglutarate aldolase